jgi:hypothetical protein
MVKDDSVRSTEAILRWLIVKENGEVNTGLVDTERVSQIDAPRLHTEVSGVSVSRTGSQEEL